MKEPHVYEAINQVMAAMAKEGIAKTRRNTQGAGYDFRGVDDVMNALSGHLADANLMILPRAISRESIERQTKAGGALFYTTIQMEYDFVSALDGSKHTCSMFGEAMDTSDKSSNKAASAAFKYVCFQGFCIPLEGEGEDADSKTHEPKSKVPTPPKELLKLAGEALNTKEQTWTGRIIKREPPTKTGDGAVTLDNGDKMYTNDVKMANDIMVCMGEPMEFQVIEFARKKDTWELRNYKVLLADGDDDLP